VAEVALTLILTTGALALVTSWARLATADPGFDAHDVLVQEIRLPAWQYPDETRRADFAARLLAALETLPGAQGAALTSRLPLPGPTEVWGFKIAGQDAPGGDWTQGRSAVMQLVTPGYFRLLRIPLIEGRGLGTGAEPGRVVLVSRTLAQHHWPGRSPLGATVILHEKETRVVGVFADFKQQGLAAEPGELMIQPWSQGSPAKLAALVRVAGQPMDSAASVRGALRRLDPGLPLPPTSRLEDLVARSAVGPRARALLLGLSAGIALLLALIGTYGVMAYRIGRRRREIAIRMAAAYLPARKASRIEPAVILRGE
jgi:putative ABC transport system permease protein